MPIEAREYIRTGKGYIFHNLSSRQISGLKLLNKQYGSIIKYSKNIIDLIETGDILEINNEKYEVIYDKSYEKLGILISNRHQLAVRHCSIEYIFSKNGIEEFKNVSILTHEQYNQNCYRLEE